MSEFNCHTDMMSDDFKERILISTQQQELDWMKKNIGCKLGFHDYWLVYMNGIIAVSAYFICSRCNRKRMHEVGF